MEIVLFIASFFSAIVASLSGFGIGSILTPLLALSLDTRLAVAAVALPHFIATFMRFWMLRKHLDKKVFLSFGIMSAAGGLLGALLHSFVEGNVLTLIFAALLLFSGSLGTFGWNEKLRFHGKAAWVAGALSGVFGGMVGNQGGIRAGALLTYDISREAFVATGTAVGVIVDLARLPVYLASEGSELLQAWQLILIAIFGVTAGTFAGMNLLKRIPEKVFRRVVSALILLLGFYMLYKGLVSYI